MNQVKISTVEYFKTPCYSRTMLKMGLCTASIQEEMRLTKSELSSSSVQNAGPLLLGLLRELEKRQRLENLTNPLLCTESKEMRATWLILLTRTNRLKRAKNVNVFRKGEFARISPKLDAKNFLLRALALTPTCPDLSVSAKWQADIASEVAIQL